MELKGSDDFVEKEVNKNAGRKIIQFYEDVSEEDSSEIVSESI